MWCYIKLAQATLKLHKVFFQQHYDSNIYSLFSLTEQRYVSRKTKFFKALDGMEHIFKKRKVSVYRLREYYIQGDRTLHVVVILQYGADIQGAFGSSCAKRRRISEFATVAYIEKWEGRKYLLVYMPLCTSVGS